MATFDRRPARAGAGLAASVQRLTRDALDAPARRNTRWVTADVALALEDDDLFVDTTAGAVVVTLPRPGLATDRTVLVQRWAGGNTATVACAPGDTLALGGTTVVLSAVGTGVHLKSVTLADGTAAWMQLP